MHLERELLREQLVEFEASPCGMRALVERRLRSIGRRLVQVAHRIGECPEPARRPNPGWQGLAEQRGFPGQRPQRELAQRVLGEPSGGRVDGRQSIRERSRGVDDAERRMHHLQPKMTLANLAESAYALARRQRFLVTGIEM